MNKEKIFLIAITICSFSFPHIGYAASATPVSSENLATLTKQISSLQSTATKLSTNIDTDEQDDVTDSLKELSELKNSLKNLNSDLSSCKNVVNGLQSLNTVVSKNSSLGLGIKGNWITLLENLTTLKAILALL
ncbi:MAG: hypothetical protein WCS30_08095 [Selenomonadaceae bacterium]